MVAKVAIADDDSETLDLLREILRGPATAIYTASSGAELVVLLSEHGPFDLIVTDVDMPWMDGIAAIRSARGSEVQAPVLVISGISRPDLPAEVARLGNAKLLQKPILVSDVRKAVSELLGATR
jgi:CheY-like chemotaxis protein